MRLAPSKDNPRSKSDNSYVTDIGYHDSMTSKSRTKKPIISLSQGRPPLAKQTAPSQSSKETRKSIRRFHQLQKAKAQALHNGEDEKASHIQKSIDSHGGLAKYQAASLLGQSNDRGGDSSKVLVRWIQNYLANDASRKTLDQEGRSSSPLRLLEVGALSPINACSQSKLFKMTRIDLRSLHPSIKRQDFMKRPLPAGEDDVFDVISLSLVLNCVSDPSQRGDMLRRTCQFLRQDTDKKELENSASSAFYPSLFLVLPASCVTNSRYLTEERLNMIMESMGYTILRRKLTKKLIYYLWRYDPTKVDDRAKFSKVEVKPGRNRNNFAVVLKSL